MRIGRLQLLATVCCTLAAGGVSAQIDGSAGGTRSVAPRAQEGLRAPTDAQLALEVQSRLRDEIGNTALSADVVDGVATLRGSAASEDQRDAAGKVARRVDGVTRVRNEIAVDPQAARDANRRNADERAAGDETAAVASNEHTKPTRGGSSEGASKRDRKRAIDDAVTAKIRSESTLLGTDIKVDVDKDGTVTLTGEVGSLANRDLAGRLAAQTQGVTQVHNKLDVRGG